MRLLSLMIGMFVTQAANITGWVFTPQGLVTGSATCGQNFSIVYSVSNSISNLSLVSIQSTGGFGGTVTVGTPMSVSFIPDTNTTVNYTCPQTFTPGFGGTRYDAVIIVDSTTYKSSPFSIAAAPSPSKTPSITPSGTPTPSMSNGSTATPTVSQTISVSPTISFTPTVTTSSTPTGTSSDTPSPSPTPTPRTVIDANDIKTQTQTMSYGIMGAAIGIALFIVCIGYITVRAIEKNRARERRLRNAKLASERRLVYEPTTFSYSMRH